MYICMYIYIYVYTYYIYIYIHAHTHKHIRVPSFLKLSSLGLDVVSRKAEAQTESKEDGSARHQALRKM